MKLLTKCHDFGATVTLTIIFVDCEILVLLVCKTKGECLKLLILF